MASGHGKKLSADQKLAQMQRSLLAAADAALTKPLQPQSAADTYFALICVKEDLEDLRANIFARTRQKADSKRFWTAFGMNTPLVAGLLLLEPVSGTVAVLTTVLTGYTPTVLIKRMLDDHRVGDAAAIKSVSMDIETIDIITDALKQRCTEVSDRYAKEMLADKDHRLFKHYRELTESFHRAALRRHVAAYTPEPAPRQKRFGT
ncbi:MAG: hypothetical protein Q8K65_02085 [Alphaproteobacteria bacterium]|nr:hypothetical protein [Alphaproteobacteria bacterium]